MNDWEKSWVSSEAHAILPSKSKRRASFEWLFGLWFERNLLSCPIRQTISVPWVEIPTRTIFYDRHWWHSQLSKRSMAYTISDSVWIYRSWNSDHKKAGASGRRPEIPRITCDLTSRIECELENSSKINSRKLFRSGAKVEKVLGRSIDWQFIVSPHCLSDVFQDIAHIS
jgi:hypothetical protein